MQKRVLRLLRQAAFLWDFPYSALQGQPLNRVLSNGAFSFLPAIGLCRIPATATLFLTSIPGFGGLRRGVEKKIPFVYF